jgi:shikimate dehydrogenase
MRKITIRGTTKLVALLGDPVAHSISPQIHNHAFAALGLDYAYVPLQVSRSEIGSVVTSLRACGFAGANVTIPHKNAVVPYCDLLSPLSEATGTVNTLYFQDGLLHGTTTDPEGFFTAVEEMGYSRRNGKVVILGNGGTARTLGIALALEGIVDTLTLVGRNESRVGPLADEITRRTGFSTTWTLFDADDLSGRIGECDLLVNCTSVGMHPNTEKSPLRPELFHSGMFVFDTIYNPERTAFLHDAARAGCTIANGLTMLLYQGLASSVHWTGRVVPPDLFDPAELRELVHRK